MSKRRGDWQDLLSTYALALKPNKIYVGYLAVLYTLFVMVIAVAAYGVLAAAGLVSPPVAWVGSQGGVVRLLAYAWGEGGLAMVRAFSPLLNPFFDGTIAHFILSVLTYAALFLAWSGPGGIISRLTALEYARDDLPTLADAREMVKSRRMAYFLAPVWPLIFVVVLVFLNFLGGLVASIPYVGRILLVVPGFPLLVITSSLIVLLVLFGALSYGLMMPAVSVGGKDALDGWSTSYTYVLWGSGRYICYTALAGAIGVAGFVVATWLTQLLVAVLVGSVDLGYVLSSPWASLSTAVDLKTPDPTGFSGFMSTIMGVLLLGVRALPYAYFVAFFFSANTVIFFLLRKHVDNIDVEEIYEESEEEEAEGEEFQPETEAAPEPEAAAEPEPAESDETPPGEAEESEAEAEPEDEPSQEPESDTDESTDD